MLDLCAGDPWKTLCHFLCCEAPDFPFPQGKYFRDAFEFSDTPFNRIPIEHCELEILEPDINPWIIPFEKLSSFGVLREEKKYGNLVGSFNKLVSENFFSFDTSLWRILDKESFPSNLGVFRKENVCLLEGCGIRMTLAKAASKRMGYSAGSIASCKMYQFGRFEIEMKPAKIAGVITGFFLHRINPWQEIDFEFLGQNTTKMLTNVYFNPGDPGSKLHFGYRGTPVVLDLNFDAAHDFHRYAIEWSPHEVRWFVDERLVHVRGYWEPTPVPNLPMHLMLNVWPSRSDELVGTLCGEKLPIDCDVKSVEISSWSRKA